MGSRRPPGSSHGMQPGHAAPGWTAGLSYAWGGAGVLGPEGFSWRAPVPPDERQPLDCWSDLDELKGARSLETEGSTWSGSPAARSAVPSGKVMLACSVRQISTPQRQVLRPRSTAQPPGLVLIHPSLLQRHCIRAVAGHRQ